MFNYKQLEEWLLEELRLICQQNHIFITLFGQPQRVEGKKSCAVIGMMESRNPGQGKLLVRRVYCACSWQTATCSSGNGHPGRCYHF